MKNWKQYEVNSCKYLSDNIKMSNITFVHKGGSDSNESDIEVFYKGNKIFSIESKLSPSQCGQIVVIENENNELVISTKMRFVNSNSSQIISTINQNLELKCSNDILIKWVKEHYKNKGSLFFITSNTINGFNSIVPIDLIDKYFNITAVVRRKRSGTRSVPKRELGNVKNQTSTHLSNKGVKQYNLIEESNNLYLIMEDETNMDSKIKYFGNYFISETDISKKYKIKVRAQTNNINIVFSIQYIGEQKNIGLNLVKDKINQLI